MAAASAARPCPSASRAARAAPISQANVSVGGTGGGGGDGGKVEITNSGDVTTHSAFSVGLWAHSVGGGGGGGGSADADLMVGDGSGKSYAASVGVGGIGGQGGNGGEVKVDNSGTIVTGMKDGSPDPANGTGSVGILAQSVGGGGGFGGAAKAKISGDEANLQGSLGLGIGGRGNVQGDGGKVDVVNSGAITTGGDDAHAIVAESIGGGGGFGGTGSVGTAGKYSIGGGFGGTGGGGQAIDDGSIGDGGAVTVMNSNTLTTHGRMTYGILAQSIGGGGGAGGVGSTTATGGTSLTAGIGGGGGASGSGGDVKVDNTGKVETFGTASHGIVAESVGGGGGAGGGAAAMGTSDNNIGGALGGTGGTSGGSGDVKVTNFEGAEIHTHGLGAHGILAQSIGGGGGVGGTAEAQSGGSLGISFTIGGGGGSAGDSGHRDPGTGAAIGNAVSVVNAGLIETEMDLSFGILAQSIGGGGGAGGGGINSSSSSTTIGGGLAGGGGAAGRGGNVEVENEATGIIRTHGNDAIGIFAQSVGGGGGVGGAATINCPGDGNNTSLTVAGSGAHGGDAGDVTVTVDGTIETFGERSHGVVAQSIGGGGGYGGSAAANEGTTALAIGGAGGRWRQRRRRDRRPQRQDHHALATILSPSSPSRSAAAAATAGRASGRFDISVPSTARLLPRDKGEGGIVTVTQNEGSDILTIGERSHGIFAQGVAGGGGIGGFGNNAFAGSGGGDGDAKAVETTSMSDVRALGDNAYAIFGQSAAGTGTGAEVTLNVQKVARATGMNSVAVYGESSGNGGPGQRQDQDRIVQATTSSGAATERMAPACCSLAGTNNTC